MTTIELISFGHKYGDENGDLKFDLRFIPNPFYVENLRPLTGMDKICADYVFSSPVAKKTFSLLSEIVITTASGFEGKDREKIKVAIGCTGGQHRSVAFTEALAAKAEAAGFPVSVRHREVEARKF